MLGINDYSSYLMAYLELQNLSTWYGAVQATKDITLSIEEGELLTFLGPSGSGKSTILMSTAGFVQPRNGRIILDGKDITDLPPNKRGIGMVFQSYALFPHKRVFDNVAYPLKVRKQSRREIEKRVMDVLSVVRLDGLETRMPHQLSGGQQQRVALARALVFNPKLLCLDEPLGALDKSLREEMQFEIRRIQREFQCTVLYVTHDQNEAMALSDRIAVLRNGAVEQVATPIELYEQPENCFVAGFIGRANFLPVVVQTIDNNQCSLSWESRSIRSVPRPSWLNRNGVEAILMIRPEHIQMEDGETGGENTIPCRVEESYYLGEVNQLKCSLSNGLRFDVRQKSTSARNPVRGDTILLKIATEKTRLFPRKSSKAGNDTYSEG